MELNEALKLVLELAEMNAITDYQAGDSDDLVDERDRQQAAFETFKLHLAELEGPSPIQCVISMDGGLITEIVTNVPMECTIVDGDIEGVSIADVITLSSMGDQESYVRQLITGCDPTHVAAILGEIDSKKQ